jgi:hypothetical protein
MTSDFLTLVPETSNMKNRSSNSGSGVNSNSSSSIHGVSSVASNHHNSTATSMGVTTGNNIITSGSSFLLPDEFHESDNLESQRLLNNDASDIVSNNNKNRRNLKFLPISILFLSSILVFYVGWYGPRKLMDQYIDAIIERNTPPYQIIQADSKNRIVLLDSTYNHPVIDPPKISCTSKNADNFCSVLQDVLRTPYVLVAIDLKCPMPLIDLYASFFLSFLLSHTTFLICRNSILFDFHIRYTTAFGVMCMAICCIVHFQLSTLDFIINMYEFFASMEI